MKFFSCILLLFFAYTYAYANDSPIASDILNQYTGSKNLCKKPLIDLEKTKKLLAHYNKNLSPAAKKSLLNILACVNKKDLKHNHILAFIDYSLPSAKKRLWVFDLRDYKLLFNTYVSHGINSGTSRVSQFSNRYNSKASSIGVFTVGKPYYGRHGLSIKLHGKEYLFNNNAYNRAIVMHAAWYVNSRFIENYGRSGRSWGCPAVPKELIKPIINTIQNGALFIVYYPSAKWHLSSKFLSCHKKCLIHNKQLTLLPTKKIRDSDSEVLFIDMNDNQRYAENEPIFVMNSKDYKGYFSKNPPLNRMLRRQVNNDEYIALNNEDLHKLDINQDSTLDAKDNDSLNKIHFAIPEVKRVRGIWATQFRFLNIKEIKSIELQNQITSQSTLKSYVINFNDNSRKNIRTTERFIRWLGL